ncbi:hypothetical protein GV64_19675 [Endozoicomonas elysicola]|uniref:Uncharacterized protein n=2 Tax=Endozoicomonas elysicola TaxID=305900 RepID=A0A081KES9_9GAMM|nr:hypothetical protein GV64_19675 [Endozoicomonas elysicola]
MDTTATVGHLRSDDRNMEVSSPSVGGCETARFMGLDATEAEGARYSRSSDSSESKSSIRDRIAYPFRAIKNQLIQSAFWGGVAGAAVGFSIPAFVGYVTGSIAGGIVKLAKMIGCQNSNARKIGAAIGLITGGLVGLPVAVALAAVGVAAGVVIGTAGSVVKLPVDIYRAATLDKSELNPWELEAKKHQEEFEARMRKMFMDLVADTQMGY